MDKTGTLEIFTSINYFYNGQARFRRVKLGTEHNVNESDAATLVMGMKAKNPELPLEGIYTVRVWL